MEEFNKKDEFYYCKECNNVYEYRNLNSKDCPRCIHPEHNKAIITDKQYIDWEVKNRPILNIKKKKNNDK